MNKKRLQKLADHLRTVPAKRLDMNNWSCGTSACAMGHACEIPSFKRAGLKLVTEIDVDGEVYAIYPVFDGRFGFSAAEGFFGIEYEDGEHLFSLGAYAKPPTPTGVAKRIEALIARASK